MKQYFASFITKPLKYKICKFCMFLSFLHSANINTPVPGIVYSLFKF